MISCRCSCLALVAWTALVAAVPPRAGATSDSIIIVESHGPAKACSLGDARKQFASPTSHDSLDAAGITFRITYSDDNTGFMDPHYGAAARECLHNTLAYVAEVLDYESGELDIHVRRSELDASGPIASAGTVALPLPGVHIGATLHRLNTGQKLVAGIPEISLTVDFGWPLYMGHDTPGPEELDLPTVLLHEITHGLGFISYISSNGFSAAGPGVYSAFDAMLANRAGTPLIRFGGPLPVFQLDPSILTNRDVGFTGTYAVAQFGANRPVPVYAPEFFSSSSLSHWSFGAVVGDVVMEPSLAPGASRRAYAPQDLGAVIDLKNYSLGYGVAAQRSTGCLLHATDDETAAATGDWLVLLLAIGAMLGCSRLAWATSGQASATNAR
jgi:hypothetical protein